jgi:hypothetical protein
MIFFLANLSIIEITFELDVASTLSVAILNALIALRVVLCWYLNTLLFRYFWFSLELTYDLPFYYFFFYYSFFVVRKESNPCYQDEILAS